MGAGLDTIGRIFKWIKGKATAVLADGLTLLQDLNLVGRHLGLGLEEIDLVGRAVAG